jgi:LCP family protein required for cell wall assembly
MEDGGGGLSVADLVQRHGISRPDLSPANQDAHGGSTSGRPRPGEPADAPQWPEHGSQGAPHPAPGGYRSVADPQGYSPAEPPGYRAAPEGFGAPDDGYGPAQDFAPGGFGPGPGMPDDRYGAAPGMPDNGYGHGAPDHGFGGAPRHNGMADNGFGPAPGMPDDRFGPAPGLPDNNFGPAPGLPDDGYGPGGAPGHNGMADNGYGPAPGMPDDRFGPGRNGMPDNSFGPAPGMPDDRFGPGVAPGHHGMADDRFGPGRGGLPDESFGPGRNGMADNGYGPAPGMPDDRFGPGGAPGRNGMADEGFGMPDDGFGPGAAPGHGFGPGGPPGRNGMPDNGFGPAAGMPGDGFGPVPDGGYGPGRGLPDDGFGPGGMPDNGFGPGVAPGRGAPDDGFRPGAPDFGPGPADFGPGQGPADFGPGQGVPDEGFGPGRRAVPGPGQTSGSYAVPPGAGRGLPPGRRAMPDDGFGPGGYGPDEGFGDFGPGAAPQPPDNGFGPGQGTGHRAIPPGGFGQGSGPRAVPGPGQGTGPRVVPGPGQHTGGPVLPGPGQATGGPGLPPGVPPGQPGRPVQPGPGQGTGHQPIPPEGFGPGQGSGYRALPGHPSGAINRDDVLRNASGAINRDDVLRNASGAIDRDQVLGRQEPDDRPAIPPTRAGSDERPGQRPPRPGERADEVVPLPPPRKPERDAISMTTEMEAIGEDVQKRRGIDHTLARFSAVHDEIQAEERQRKAKRRKLTPWRREDEEMDELDVLVAGQTLAVQRPGAKPDPAPEALTEMLPEGPDGDGRTRLQEKKSRRLDRSKLAIRVAAATAAILVFVATGVAWGFKSWVDASSQQVDALDPNSKDIQDAAKQRGDENFLLVGSDTRAGAEAEDGVGSEKEIVGARSDTVMIAHIPADRERAVVVSFPRDLEVRRPACEGWDPKSGDYTGEQKPAAEQVKLNTAYQVGGPKCVTKLVQQLSGLMINHFVGIDFHGFKGMVDAVRGVQVCVERPLKDDILGTVVPVAGKNVTLTGDQALNFVRARHVQGDVTSDYGRIIRQQRFLSSLLRKAMSSEVLLDPGKLSDFVQAFSKSTFGDNIGVDQMVTLGQSLQGIQAGKVTFITVPTVGEANENGNEDLRADDNKSLFRAIREDTPLPGEKSGTQQLQSLKTAPAPADPKSIKVQVLNGGNPTGGIAGGTADQLTELGYQVVWVDAAPEKVKSTIIKYAKGSEAQAQLLRSSVPDAELVEDPSLAGAIQLIIGPGFDGKVVAPGKGKPGDPLPSDLSTVNGGDVSCA